MGPISKILEGPDPPGTHTIDVSSYNCMRRVDNYCSARRISTIKATAVLSALYVSCCQSLYRGLTK